MRTLKHVDQHPKSGVFRFRPHVPQHLRAFLPQMPGTRSLHTKDRQVAFRRALPLVQQFQSMLADAETAYAAREASTPLVARLTLADAGRLVEDWTRSELARIANEIANES